MFIFIFFHSKWQILTRVYLKTSGHRMCIHCRQSVQGLKKKSSPQTNWLFVQVFIRSCQVEPSLKFLQFPPPPATSSSQVPEQYQNKELTTFNLYGTFRLHCETPADASLSSWLVFVLHAQIFAMHKVVEKDQCQQTPGNRVWNAASDASMRIYSLYNFKLTAISMHISLDSIKPCT